jgi:hypothetical protein
MAKRLGIVSEFLDQPMATPTTKVTKQVDKDGKRPRD